MTDLSDWLFDPSGLTPHGFCLLWKPGLIWTYAIADSGIALAYFSIPIALVVFDRRRQDFQFRPFVWLFASFILLCGSTHWLDVLTLWRPAYGLEAVFKAATAAVSLFTALALWRLMPLAIALPSPRQYLDLDKALARSELRHRTSFERSPVPLYCLDEKSVITAVSDTWLALLGYEADEVIGRPITDFHLPNGITQKSVSHPAPMGNYEMIRDQEQVFQTRQGDVIEALVSAQLDRRDDGASVTCALIDVTARRRAEAALKASEERLRHSLKMEAVGQLTGGIAHDFNNMLQSVSGALELMDRLVMSGHSNEIGQHIRIAQRSVSRAANLTNRMLTFARRQSLQPSAVNLTSLFLSLEELIQRTIGPAIQIKLSAHQGTWMARCDINQLESALLNLAINARDAMTDGGTLIISSADRTLTAADLTDQPSSGPGDFVEISVTDTGTGMAAEVLARVFEPFYTTKPIGQGTGLGLSQVYGFVTQSGGLVKVDSTVGHGTTIHLYLPRDVSYEGAVAQSIDLPPDHGINIVANRAAGRSVLVVDDEPSVRYVMVSALQQIGFDVREAENASEALDIIRSPAPIEALVTDIGMPGMNGLELARSARKLRNNLPVLLITGFASAAQHKIKTDSGIDVMRKPFSIDALCNRICAMLPALSLPHPIDLAEPSLGRWGSGGAT